MARSYLCVALAVASILAITHAQLNQTAIVTTCGCFFGTVNGNNKVYCGASCGLSGKDCPSTANQNCSNYPVTEGFIVNSQARWGSSSVSYQPYLVSGMGFTGLSQTVLLEREIFIGQLFHFNNPIYNAASSTSLRLQVTINISNVIVRQTFTFTFAIDETPNNQALSSCPYPSTIPCSDKITFPSGASPGQSFTIGGVNYTVLLTGFKEDNTSSSLARENFISNEKKDNVAYLFAKIAPACPATCAGGNGEPVVVQLPSGALSCRCICTSTCVAPAYVGDDCLCTCPNSYCNGYGADPDNNCTCDCAEPNDPPDSYTPLKNVWNSQICDYQCPDAVQTCGVGLMDPNDCTCVCDYVDCGNLQADPDDNCSCACLRTCGPSQVLNMSTCSCQCVNGTCESGRVWALDPQTGSCGCLCDSFCGICNNGSNPYVCGKDSSIHDQCCGTNCLGIFDGVCDDQDLCTVADKCQHAPSNSTFNSTKAICAGVPKCPPSFDMCTINSCTNGTCLSTFLPDHSFCSPPGITYIQDKCKYQCLSGTCVTMVPKDCDREALNWNTSVDMTCSIPVCNPVSGQCEPKLKVNKQCDDKKLCTRNDRCNANGDCDGDPVACNNSAVPCHQWTCSHFSGLCEISPVVGANATCEPTVGDLCHTSGTCLGGVCILPLTCPPLVEPQSLCLINVCNSADGTCSQVPRPAGAKCVLDSGYVKPDDKCFYNYTCDGVVGICSGVQRPNYNSIPQCVVTAIVEEMSSSSNSGLIGGLVALGVLLLIILGVALFFWYVTKKALLETLSWQNSTDVGLESNPLYDEQSGSGQNPLFAQ